MLQPLRSLLLLAALWSLAATAIRAQRPAEAYDLYEADAASNLQLRGRVSFQFDQKGWEVAQVTFDRYYAPPKGQPAVATRSGLFYDPHPDSTADDRLVIAEGGPYATTLAVYTLQKIDNQTRTGYFTGLLIEQPKNGAALLPAKGTRATSAQLSLVTLGSELRLDGQLNMLSPSPFRAQLLALPKWTAPNDEKNIQVFNANINIADMAQTGIALLVEDLLILAYGANSIEPIRLHFLRRAGDTWEGWEGFVARTDQPTAGQAVLWQPH